MLESGISLDEELLVMAGEVSVLRVTDSDDVTRPDTEDKVLGSVGTLKISEVDNGISTLDSPAELDSTTAEEEVLWTA